MPRDRKKGAQIGGAIGGAAAALPAAALGGAAGYTIGEGDAPHLPKATRIKRVAAPAAVLGAAGGLAGAAGGAGIGAAIGRKKKVKKSYSPVSAFGIDHGVVSKNFRMPGSFAPTISKPVQPVKPQKPGAAIQKPQQPQKPGGLAQGAASPMQRFMANRRPSMGGPVSPGMTSQAGKKPMGQSMMQPRSPMSRMGQTQPGGQQGR